MPRPRITVSPEFYEAVTAYQEAHGLASWAQAAVELMVAGYRVKTGKDAPQAVVEWGGKRERPPRH